MKMYSRGGDLLFATGECSYHHSDLHNPELNSMVHVDIPEFGRIIGVEYSEIQDTPTYMYNPQLVIGEFK